MLREKGKKCRHVLLKFLKQTYYNRVQGIKPQNESAVED